MRKYKIIFGILMLLIVSVVSAQDDLNRYLEIAAENNPALKAKFSEYMAALEVAPQVKALPDPKLAFGYFIQPVETRVGPQQFKFSASQMFPWFGTLRAKENAAVQSAKAKYELFEESKSELYNQVKSTYFNLYFNKKAVGITLENIEILNTFRQLAVIKIEAGLVSPVDEYRLEMEINDLENQLALLRDKQAVLEVTFNNLLNIEANSLIDTPENIWMDDFTLMKEAALNSIKSFNHQLLSIELQQTALQYKKEVAERQGNPDFTVGFDYTVIGKGDNNMAGTDAFVFPTIGITIPLYRNKYKAMVQEVAYLESAKGFEQVNKVNMLETLFENGWKDYQDACRRIGLYGEQLELAGKSMNLLGNGICYGQQKF